MSTEQKVTRKLRAILCADVKGYSLLMADDEAFTVKTLKEYRKILTIQVEPHEKSSTEQFNVVEQINQYEGDFYV